MTSATADWKHAVEDLTSRNNRSKGEENAEEEEGMNEPGVFEKKGSENSAYGW